MANATSKLFVAGLLAVLPVSAGKPGGVASAQSEGTIAVCVNSGPYVSPNVLIPAEAITSRMFATAVRALAWHCGGMPASREYRPVRSVILDLSIDTPPSDHPGALAYALPYQGVHIVVLFDRVQSGGELTGQVPTLLAHVMTHEITHLLQGISRHSETGVMKAHWDGRDLCQMRKKPLPFAPEDILLIQNGIRPRIAAARASFQDVAQMQTPNHSNEP